MVKVSAQTQQLDQQFVEGENSIDSRLELLKIASQVQSRIKKDISEDFILAKLKPQDIEGIIEMTSNAYFVKKILLVLAKKGKKYTWNDKTKTWSVESISQDKQEFIEETSNAIFDSYLNRIYMTVILNRNVQNNHIIQIIAGDKGGETEIDAEDLKTKIKNLVQPEEQKV